MPGWLLMHVLNGGLARHLAADRRANELGGEPTRKKPAGWVGVSGWEWVWGWGVAHLAPSREGTVNMARCRQWFRPIVGNLSKQPGVWDSLNFYRFFFSLFFISFFERNSAQLLFGFISMITRHLFRFSCLTLIRSSWRFWPLSRGFQKILQGLVRDSTWWGHWRPRWRLPLNRGEMQSIAESPSIVNNHR